jgi:hypothetical protein
MVAEEKPKPDLYLELAGMSDRKACTMTVDTQAKFSSDCLPQLGLGSPASPDLTSSTQCRRCAFTCTTLVSPTSML